MGMLIIMSTIKLESIEDIEKDDSLDDVEKSILILALNLQKQSDRELKKILSEYKSQLEQLRKELGYLYVQNSNQDGVMGNDYFKRLKITQAVKKTLQDMGRDLSEHEKAVMTLALTKAYKNSYYNSIEVIDKALRTQSERSSETKDREIEPLDAAEVERVVNEVFKGDIYSNRVVKNNEKLINEVNGIIANGIVDGKSMAEINKAVKDSFDKAAYRSKGLLETEIFRVFGKATIAAGVYRGVQKVRYSAVLDERTCSECASFDGNTYDIDYAPELPRHKNCRCILYYLFSGNYADGNEEDYDEF